MQWYEQQSHGGNPLHYQGWRETPADPIFLSGGYTVISLETHNTLRFLAEAIIP
jgi:hypothetical protein